MLLVLKHNLGGGLNWWNEDHEMATKSLFISHIAEEAGFADALKTQIESALPGLEAFSSSSDIVSGDQWLAKIDKALQKAGVLLVLCSRRSVERRWISFEAGAVWGRKRPVIPLCHTDLRVEDLPDPLHDLPIGRQNGSGDAELKRVCGWLSAKLV